MACKNGQHDDFCNLTSMLANAKVEHSHWTIGEKMNREETASESFDGTCLVFGDPSGDAQRPYAQMCFDKEGKLVEAKVIDTDGNGIPAAADECEYCVTSMLSLDGKPDVPETSDLAKFLVTLDLAKQPYEYWHIHDHLTEAEALLENPETERDGWVVCSGKNEKAGMYTQSTFDQAGALVETMAFPL